MKIKRHRRQYLVAMFAAVIVSTSFLFVPLSSTTHTAHAAGTSSFEWSAQSLPHIIGRNSADGRLTIVTDGSGYMQYGPYTTSVAAGPNTTTWYLMVDNNTADNGRVVRLEVNDATTSTVLATQDITRQQWKGTYDYEAFSLNFTLPAGSGGHSLEFRVWSYGISYVRELKVRIGSPPAITDTRAFTPGTLADYWNGNAHWNFWQKITATSTGRRSVFDGTSMKVMPDGTWYLFSRNTYLQPPYCANGQPHIGTQVQKSTDHGLTWSSPVQIIVPTSGTAWECDATDGDAYYNAAQNKWYYLAQCLAGNGPWNACEFEQTGADPTAGGLFTPRSTSPVLTNGQLWHQICNEASDDCVRLAGGTGRFGDEGTFDIFQFDGTYYWIAFHGAYYGNGYVQGVRGIAKTSDLGDGSKYIAENTSQGVPTDAVLDADDDNQHSWRESWVNGATTGSIGAGAGSIIAENGYYYLLSEFADVSLGCTSGQNWDLAMFRSTSLTNTNWDQYPGGNPVIYSSHAPDGAGPNEGQWSPCNIQYGHLFKDPTTGTIYLMYGRRSADPDYDGIYFYRLDKTPNLLSNSDLWRADTAGWNTFGSTTALSAPRLPNNSPDGTPYMLMECGGGSCAGDHSVYQDVALPNGGTTFNFGGQFATDWGTGDSTGRLELVVWQFDGNSNLITSTRLPSTVGSNYTSVTGQVTLNPNTRKIRFQVYLYDTIKFRADNMYFSPA